jgi:outer membrane receptor protein involved in Fe transport
MFRLQLLCAISVAQYATDSPIRLSGFKLQEVTMRSYKTAIRTLGSALLGILLFAANAQAQNIFGSIVGTVSDSSGAVLPGATVTVTNVGTGEKREVAADGQGNYQVLSLPRGQYKIDIDSHGFKHFTQASVDVVVNQVTRLNVSMSVGEESQQVTVDAAPPIMQTDSASLGQAVTGKAVQTLPLNGRNVLALVALVPGVIPQGASATNLTGQNVFAAGNYQIGGGNSNQGSVLVDGVSVNTSYGNAVELVMDQDSVQEFNVQTHNNTAEFGAYTGGVINMSTKSGTNNFHADAYEYVRNTLFNANNFFANRTGAGRQAWHQNQFGVNGGGPILKNKVFIFGAYQGYRQTNGQPVTVTVPTAAQLTGDFSANSAKIYDPLTTCGIQNGRACDPGEAVGTRTPFPGNIVPAGRMSTVAKNLIKYPLYGKPNTAGIAGNWGASNNFSKFATAGGKNDQFTVRGDETLSSKQTMFQRYTRWNSMNIDPKPFEPDNNLYFRALAPEAFTTHQIAVGDTYVFSPTSVVDIHLGYLRWNYTRIPTNLGLNESTAFGWPSYMDFGHLNNLPKSTSVPTITTSGPISYYHGLAGYIFSINNNYSIASTYQKILGRHTLKTGVDLRRLEMQYFQNNSPGGVFTFDNIFTSQNVASSGSSGHPLASFELGYMATSTAQTVQAAPPTYQTQYYQGYFVQDTWQATNKLTFSFGLRYEVPGVFVARQGGADTFNPTETNPITGNPGAFDLVSTPQHPAAGVRNENWNNWSPRVGAAYRMNGSTVIRGAWGRFFVPADLQFPEAPLQAGVNFLNNLAVNSRDNQQTPADTLDNPYPNGLQGAPHRDPSYQQVLLGGNAQALYANEPNGQTQQWNFAIEHQFPLGITLDAAYAGLRGLHLPVSRGINALPDSVLAQAAAQCPSTSNCFLNDPVPNPYFGLNIKQGVLKNATVTRNQLLRPFPQYGSIGNSGNYIGISNYHSLEMKLQKRTANGGMFLGSYTFSKLMTNAEYLTSWLDATGTAGWQDLNDPMSNYSQSSFDARQRLVVSYLYPLPIGHGQALLSNLNGVANAVIGGWGVNGITTFQRGFPLGISSSPNNLSNFAFQGNQRPDVVPSCTKTTSGDMMKRIGGAGASTYLNTACFVAPAVFKFGNESRTDNALRGPGVANWDISLFKQIHIHENALVDFRVEAFNVFNRVQFSNPDLTRGSSTFGVISTQANNPRALQLSGRFSF